MIQRHDYNTLLCVFYIQDKIDIHGGRGLSVGEVLIPNSSRNKV